MVRAMNRTPFLPILCLLSVLAGCRQPSVELAPSPSIPSYTARQFYDTTSYALVSSTAHAFSPSGEFILMSSNATGIFNAYAQPVAGGDPVPLTTSTNHAVFAVSWFPADERILYTADVGGNELNHVFVREEDGTTRDLTPGEELKARFLGWAEDGEGFYLLSTERDPAVFDVYFFRVEDYSRRLVYENPGMLVSGISRDGRWLSLDKPRTSADSNVYIVDLRAETPSPVLVTEHEGNVEHGSRGFTPDNRYLLYTTNAAGEFDQMWRYDLAGGESSALLAADWDVMYVGYSPSGRYRVSGINADARTDVTLLDTGTGEPVPLPGLPDGDLSAIRFSTDEKAIALMVNRDDAPSDLVVVSLADGSSRALTRALNPAIRRDDLVASEVVRYPSFDGLEIPAILFRPRQASANHPVPALVWVHGGPGGQSRTGYRALTQFLVNHGYAVLAANNRGSSGYGKTFFHLDDRRHGEGDLQDIVYARRYLESLDWVDGERVGIIGGSYGGYMVAAALAFEPEVFDVGVNIFGVTNWVRTLESIPPWWEAFKEALFDEMGDPSTDAERHRRISPLFHAENIVRPLLVVQGANDPRVLKIESDELVDAVRANGVPVEYVVFPDEGHGFAKRENRITAAEAYLRFLDTHLKGE